MADLLIDTPENVTLEAEIAGLGTRCMAAIIDYTILIVVLLVANLLLNEALRDVTFSNSAVATGLFLLVQFVIVTFYHMFFEFVWNGQTPGKRRLGLRVVQANGRPVTTSAIIIRNLVRLLDFLPVLYGVGLIALFVTRHAQRLGDLAAGTIVIRERPHLKLETVKEDFSVHYLLVKRIDPIPAYIRLDSLSEGDRHEIVNYLRRRATLRGRESLACLLAQRLAARMELNEPGVNLASPRQAELFLEQIVRAFEIAEHK